MDNAIIDGTLGLPVKAPEVAVVILNFNGATLLKEFVPSVLCSVASNAHFLVYIVDNGSEDDSAEVAQEIAHAHPEVVKVVLLSHNQGFAGGYNEGLAQIKADYYVLLNSDVAVSPNWLVPLVDAMERQPGLGAVQPKIRWHRNPNFFEYAGACGGFIDKWGYPFCRGRIFKRLEEDHGQYDAPVQIHWATGACLMVRASLYHRLGGLDADFFAHMEEIDLCWRMQHLGYRLMCIPESEVFHVGGATLDATSPHKTYLNFRNNLALLHKNLPTARHYVVLSMRALLDALALIVELLKGRPRHALSIGRAWIHYLIRWQHWSRMRKHINPRPLSEIGGWLNGSIVYAYFIRKIRRYDQVRPFIVYAARTEKGPPAK